MGTLTLRALKATRDLRRETALQAARRIAENAALVVKTLEREGGSISHAAVYADELPQRVRALRDNLIGGQAADDVIELLKAEEAEAAGAAPQE